MILKYYLQILALICGTIFALALALLLNLFGFKNLVYGQIFIICGLLLIFIITYGMWKTRDKNKPNITKKVISWIIFNLKFIFLPGYNLDGLDKRRNQYELYKPKSRRIHKYKSVLFLIGIITIALLCTVALANQTRKRSHSASWSAELPLGDRLVQEQWDWNACFSRGRLPPMVYVLCDYVLTGQSKTRDERIWVRKWELDTVVGAESGARYFVWARLTLAQFAQGEGASECWVPLLQPGRWRWVLQGYPGLQRGIWHHCNWWKG